MKRKMLAMIFVMALASQSAIAADYHYSDPGAEAVNDENCHYWKRQMESTCSNEFNQYQCDSIKQFMVKCANQGMRPTTQYRPGEDQPTAQERHDYTTGQYNEMQHQQCIANCNANSSNPQELSMCKAQCK